MWPWAGRTQRTVAVDAAKHPAKARMAEKLSTEAGRARYAQRKWLSEAPNGWIKGGARFPPIQPARSEQGAGRVESGVSGIERQADAGASGSLMTAIPPANQAERGTIQTPGAHAAAPRRPKRPFPGHRYRSIAISRNSPSRKSSYSAGS